MWGPYAPHPCRFVLETYVVFNRVQIPIQKTISMMMPLNISLSYVYFDFSIPKVFIEDIKLLCFNLLTYVTWNIVYMYKLLKKVVSTICQSEKSITKSKFIFLCFKKGLVFKFDIWMTPSLFKSEVGQNGE